MKVYKIRHKETGLFSTGGMKPKWTNQGKVWQRLNYVHSHISQLISDYTPADVYKDAEIVEAEITEILTPIEEPKDYLNAKYDEMISYQEKRAKEDPNNTFWKWEQTVEKTKGRKALLNGSA